VIAGNIFQQEKAMPPRHGLFAFCAEGVIEARVRCGRNQLQGVRAGLELESASSAGNHAEQPGKDDRADHGNENTDNQSVLTNAAQAEVA
jgi:hypothetical protein